MTETAEELTPEPNPAYFDGKPIGQVAYEAYFDACGGLSITGALLPPWQTVPAHIRSHWQRSAIRTARLAIARYQPAPDPS